MSIHSNYRTRERDKEWVRERENTNAVRKNYNHKCFGLWFQKALKSLEANGMIYYGHLRLDANAQDGNGIYSFEMYDCHSGRNSTNGTLINYIIIIKKIVGYFAIISCCQKMRAFTLPKDISAMLQIVQQLHQINEWIKFVIGEPSKWKMHHIRENGAK